MRQMGWTVRQRGHIQGHGYGPMGGLSKVRHRSFFGFTMRNHTGSSSILYFSAGLHDYMSCMQPRPAEMEKSFGPRDDNRSDCVAGYRSHLRTVASIMRDFKGVKIFRMATASWLKWGNQNMKWDAADANVKQRLASEQRIFFSRYMLPHLNRVAFEVLCQEHGWYCIDAYNITLPHVDATAEEDPPGPLVHCEQPSFH